MALARLKCKEFGRIFKELYIDSDTLLAYSLEPFGAIFAVAHDSTSYKKFLIDKLFRRKLSQAFVVYEKSWWHGGECRRGRFKIGRVDCCVLQVRIGQAERVVHSHNHAVREIPAQYRNLVRPSVFWGVSMKKGRPSEYAVHHVDFRRPKQQDGSGQFATIDVQILCANTSKIDPFKVAILYLKYLYFNGACWPTLSLELSKPAKNANRSTCNRIELDLVVTHHSTTRKFVENLKTAFRPVIGVVQCYRIEHPDSCPMGMIRFSTEQFDRSEEPFGLIGERDLPKVVKVMLLARCRICAKLAKLCSDNNCCNGGRDKSGEADNCLKMLVFPAPQKICWNRFQFEPQVQQQTEETYSTDGTCSISPFPVVIRLFGHQCLLKYYSIHSAAKIPSEIFDWLSGMKVDRCIDAPVLESSHFASQVAPRVDDATAIFKRLDADWVNVTFGDYTVVVGILDVKGSVSLCGHFHLLFYVPEQALLARPRDVDLVGRRALTVSDFQLWGRDFSFGECLFLAAPFAKKTPRNNDYCDKSQKISQRKLPKYCGQNLAKAQKRQYLHLTNRSSSSMIQVLRETEAGIDSSFGHRRSEPRSFLRGFLMAGRIGEPSGSPVPVDWSVNPMRPVTILTGGGWVRQTHRRATMSEQQAKCAATTRKLLIDDIWTELAALEERLGDGQELAHTVITFSENLDHKEPMQRCFIALVGFWHDQQIESKKAFNRVVNRVNELRDAS